MFRAFLHNENEQVKNIEYISEYKEFKNENELQNYLNIKSNNGFELIKIKNTIKSFLKPLYGYYIFKKETIEIQEMSINEYINNIIMLKKVLETIHAPYMDHNN